MLTLGLMWQVYDIRIFHTDLDWLKQICGDNSDVGK